MKNLTPLFTGKFKVSCYKVERGKHELRVMQRIVIDLSCVQGMYYSMEWIESENGLRKANVLCLEFNNFRCCLIRDELSEHIHKIYEDEKI